MESTALVCTCGMLRKFPITACFSDSGLGLTRGGHAHVTFRDVCDRSPGKQT